MLLLTLLMLSAAPPDAGALLDRAAPRTEATPSASALPFWPLAPGRPAQKPAFTRDTLHGRLSLYREDLWTGEGVNALSLVREGAALQCPLFADLDCADRVLVEEHGDLLLACVPNGGGDLCMGNGKGRLFDSARRCVLVDVQRHECHDLSLFNDAHLGGSGGLTVDRVVWDALRRYPNSLAELLDPRPLGCDYTPPQPVTSLSALRLDLGPISSWGPTTAVRAELSYDGAFHFVRAVGIHGFSDQDELTLEACPARKKP